MANAPAGPTLADIIAGSLQELNAHVRNAKDELGGQIYGYYREAKRFMNAFDQNRGLRYRAAAITLDCAIIGASAAVSGSDFFRVSQQEDFLVQSIRGFVILNALPTEVGGAAFTNALTTTLTPQQQIIMKANNCRVTIQNKDNKVPVTEAKSLPLSSICPEAGGAIMKFQPDIVPGFIIPHNTTIEALFALQNAHLAYNTVSVQYGVILTGAYMRREIRCSTQHKDTHMATNIGDINDGGLPRWLSGLGQTTTGRVFDDGQGTVSILKQGVAAPRQVKQMQMLLNSFGYKLMADGIFGAGTAAAVKAIQQKLKMSATGIYDKALDDRITGMNQSGIIDAKQA